MKKQKDYPFLSIEEEAEDQLLGKRLPKKHVPTYELAFVDQEFLLRRELRPVRLQLEFLKAEMKQREEQIESTVVIFGSHLAIPKKQAKEEYQEAKKYAQKYPMDQKGQKELQKAKHALEKSHYYEQARKFAHLITKEMAKKKSKDFIVVTGGGPGIMEAANQGASEAKGKSIGLSIFLPTEEYANPYITPELHFQFHYFAIRKMHFLIRARALVFFPGGYGTLDELFEALTLMQTKKIKRIPILLFNKNYWSEIINFDALIEKNAIAPEDIQYFQFVESAEEAWKTIQNFYKITSVQGKESD